MSRSTPMQPLAERQPHFAPRAKRVIYLHLTGSPPHLDLFDYKPELVKRDGQDCPQTIPRRARRSRSPPACRSCWARRASSRSTARRARGCRTRCPIFMRRHRRRDVRHPVDVHRSVQSRPGRAAALHRLAALGPARDGRLGDLRPRHREPEPARLRRADLQRRAAQRRQRTRRQRLSALGVSRRAVPLEGRSGAVCVRPAGHGPRPAPPSARRACAI